MKGQYVDARYFSAKVLLIFSLSMNASCVGQEMLVDTSDKIYSVDQVISNLAEFDGKKIFVKGFLTIGFENCVVWNNKNAFIDRRVESAIWLKLSSQNCYGLKSHSVNISRYETIEGVLNINDCGHLCLFPGSLKDVKLEINGFSY